MTNSSPHVTDRIPEALDRRLSADDQRAFDAHLAECAACRLEWTALHATKAAVAQSARAVALPDDLDARLRAALDHEDAASRASAPQGTSARPAWAARLGWVAAAAAVVLAVWIGTSWFPGGQPRQAAADFRAFQANQLTLDLATADPAALEARLQDSTLPFPARVFDFGMMNYQLAGGGVHRAGRTSSALFAYRGAGDLAVVCQMYLGRVADLPAPVERRVHEDIEFLIFHEGELTVVFWQEGPVVCVLVANGDREAAAKLAFAKARRG